MLFEPIKAPNRVELRRFGFSFSLVLVGIFGLLLPWLFNHSYPPWPWIVSAIITLMGLVIPLSLRSFYRLWMYLGIRLGWLNSQILLGLVFYLILMPMGLIMRIVKRDPMKRSFEKHANSYRSISQTRFDRKHMERPF